MPPIAAEQRSGLRPAADAVWDKSAALPVGPEDRSLLQQELTAQPHHPSPASYLESKTEIVIAGNPAVGTLHLYRQNHPFSTAHPDELRGYIGESQEAILRQLLLTQPKHVFVEGKSNPPLHSRSLKDDPIGQAVALFFPDGVEFGRLTDRQKELLGKLTAPLVYASLQNDVTLHPTISLELAEKYERDQQSLAAHRQALDKIDLAQLGPDLRTRLEETRAELKQTSDYLIFEYRENLAAGKVQQFLAKNPGEQVAMVFGRLHEWNQADFGGGELSRLPVVAVASFPKIDERYPSGHALLRPLSSRGELSLQQREELNQAPAETAAKRSLGL